MTKTTSKPSDKPQVRLIDAVDTHWPAVLGLIDRLGHRKYLQLNVDGWLPVRQSVIAVWESGKPVGYVSFHVQPAGGRKIEAQLDAVGFRPAVAAKRHEPALRRAALRRARLLRCVSFKGIDAE